MLSPLATSFPALIPFLDFSGLDSSEVPLAGKEGDSKNPNHEHLEKHLVMMQEEYQQEVNRAEALQRSVDLSLERVLVWVQTVHDSLNDLSSESLSQDVRALGAVRDAVVWLAKHPCKEWNAAPNRLERILDGYEDKVRINISMERPVDAQMESLREALVASQQRVDELSEQLVEARSSAPTVGGVGVRMPRVGRNLAGLSQQSHGGGGGRGSRMEAARTLSLDGAGQLDVGVQCDLLTSSGGPPMDAQAVLNSFIDDDLLAKMSTSQYAPPALSGIDRNGSSSHLPPPLEFVETPSDERDIQSSRGGSVVGGAEDQLLSLPGSRSGSVERSRASSRQSLASEGGCFPGTSEVSGEQADGTAPSNTATSSRSRLNVGKSGESGVSGKVWSGSKGEAGSAHSVTEREAQKLRLLRCPFVEGIDLTCVPHSDRILLRPPVTSGVSGGAQATGAGASGSAATKALGATEGAGGKASGGEDKRLSLKQLQAFLVQVYNEKRVDDQKRDKVSQPRRQLHVVLQELMRRQHGVRKVVHQKCWQLVESLSHHAETNRAANTFADFLDGTRDLGELSFYLYCAKVLGNIEEVTATNTSRPQAGWVTAERGGRVIEALFGDLPKALGVMQLELEKATRVFEVERKTWNCNFSMSLDFDDFGPDVDEPRVATEELLRILLEGWRMSAVLLEQTVPSFSWAHTVLAFMQTDVLCRSWLDPHEVRDAESLRLGHLGNGEAEGLRLLDKTSMGAFVFREVHRCSAGGGSSASTALTTVQPKKMTGDAIACLKVSQVVFESLEKTLGVYLTWLMHSDELGDLAVYHSVKSRMYGFRKASGSSDGEQGTHHFRCLLLLLLSHQFDMQLQRGGMASDYLEWELGCLLRILRESWRRGAAAGSGAADEAGGEAPPDFGAELDNLGGSG
mmetsp:Transcript_123696/g.395782  ORF Transcript_123696/g.395782 Transcript_123696/m.395782 type:complete len:911 (-) Transcript_123696:73-2805(-)